YEFYLEVFRPIWGDDVVVEFVNDDPGVLLINITAGATSLDNFAAREIISGVYEYTDIIDHDDNEIMFQVLKAIKNQRELDSLINELSPVGIIVDATLLAV